MSLASGVIAGVTAAIISHPADTLLSKINKKGAGGAGRDAQQAGDGEGPGKADRVGHVSLPCGTLGRPPISDRAGGLQAGCVPAGLA